MTVGFEPTIVRDCCTSCYERVHADEPMALMCRPMIVCHHCGNKRCPHATDHRLGCTESNEPGQPGSLYR